MEGVCNLFAGIHGGARARPPARPLPARRRRISICFNASLRARAHGGGFRTNCGAVPVAVGLWLWLPAAKSDFLNITNYR